MKRSILSIIIGLLSIPAHATQDLYGAVRLQDANQSLSDQQPYSPRALGIVTGPGNTNGFAGSLALGYQLPGGWRAEAEYTTPTRSEFTTVWRWSGGLSRNVVQTRSQRLMFNAYKDFAINDWFSLYGGVGLGISRITTGGYQGPTTRQFAKDTRDNLAYSLTAGTDFRLNKTLSLGVGYRYVDLGKTRSGLNNFTNASGTRDEVHQARLREQNLFVELRANF